MAPLPPLLQQLWQELQHVTVFNSFLIFLVFFISISFLYKLITRGPKLNLPPSPPKLPIIGNLHQFGTLPHRSLLALSKKYGPIMLMHLGYSPTLVITSAELAKEMTKNHDVAFSNRPQTTAGKILLYGCVDIVFGFYGEYWRQARKVSVNQLLSLQRVQSFQFVREEEVALIIERLRCSCDNGANSVNLTEIIMSVAYNIISRCVLGQNSDKEKDGEKRFVELSKKITILVGSVCYGDLFPFLRWIDVLTGLIPRMKEAFAEMDSYLDQVIEEHRILKRKEQDFLDILLQLQSDGFALTQDKIKAILVDMTVAGSESTATTTEWIMAELVRNPTTMKKAQEEVRRVVGKNSKVKKTHIDQMGYLKCVIKETLRLNCPVPLMVPRENSTSVKLGGYDIPPKTSVFVNTWAIQRDPQLWGDRAEEFIPERFENNPIDFKGQDFEFLPFGVGRRSCPGMSFGVASVEYITANLLYSFDWALPDGITPDNMDMNEVYSLTGFKKVPLYLVPSLHSP